MARLTRSCSFSIFYLLLGLSLTFRNTTFCQRTKGVPTRLSVVVNPCTYLFPILRSLLGVVCLNFTFVLTCKENSFEGPVRPHRQPLMLGDSNDPGSFSKVFGAGKYGRRL